MPSSVIVYRNWLEEFGETEPATDAIFEPEAPASNMLTPRPGQIGIVDETTTSDVTLAFRIGRGTAGSSSERNGRRVDVVAIVNTNYLGDDSSDTAVCTVYDDADNATVCTLSAINTASDGQTQDKLIWFVSSGSGSAGAGDISRIVITFSGGRFGRRDRWTGEITDEAPYFGTVIAGPAFQPENGIRLSGFTPGMSDPSRTVRSIGGTTWASPQTRLRRMTAQLPLLTETEVEADPPLCGLRQLAEHCGLSRPLLVIPQTTNLSTLNRQAIFGLLTEEVAWPAFDKIDDDGAKVIAYQSTLSILETK